MTDKKKFQWPKYPATAKEFDRLMQAIDGALSMRGLAPFQRPMHVPHLLWEAFGWGGSLMRNPALELSPGFEGDALMAKAFKWYDDTYGDNLKSNPSPGAYVCRIGNSIWKVRVPLIFGTVEFFANRNLTDLETTIGLQGPARANALTCVEKFTQGLASRLTDRDLQNFIMQFIVSVEAVQWHGGLSGSELFQMARYDLASSTDELIAGRYGQSRWASQQALEKTLKGLLQLFGTSYPTGGRHGHDLIALAGLLAQRHNVIIPSKLIEDCACSASVRYAEEASTEDQALVANNSAIFACHAMSKSPAMTEILAKRTSIKSRQNSGN